MIKELYDTARYKMGMVSQREMIDAVQEQRTQRGEYINGLPADIGEAFRDTCSYAEDLGNCKDPDSVYKKVSNLRNYCDYVAKRLDPSPVAQEQRQKVVSFLSSGDLMQYQPAGARMWRFFLNPMAAFTFVLEQHWATKVAMRIMRTEIRDEGYKLKYLPNISPEELQQAAFKIEQLNLFEYAIDTATRFLGYGNVWTVPETNFLGDVVKLRNLRADRMWPVYSTNGEYLDHWEYQLGVSTIPYELDEVLHLKDYSMKSPYIGSPRLGPAILEIESDLAASSLNATIFNKAGMIGLIIALEDPAIKNPLKVVNMERQKERLQETFYTQFAGVRGAQSVLVANYIKDVFKLSDIGALDANFLKLRMEVAKTIALLIGVPIERMGLPRSAAAQYQASVVEEMVTASFDKEINAIMSQVYAFINQKIIRDLLGIYNVEMAQKGRFNSNTINGARMALMASQTGPLFTVNEMRTFFYKVPELAPGDKRGNKVVDNSTMRDPMLKPPLTAEIDPRDILGLSNTTFDTQSDLMGPVEGTEED